MEVEYKETIESDMNEITYATIGQKTGPIGKNKQPDKYKVLVEKLTQLGMRDWPKF